MCARCCGGRARSRRPTSRSAARRRARRTRCGRSSAAGWSACTRASTRCAKQHPRRRDRRAGGRRDRRHRTLFERAARFGSPRSGWGHLYLWRRGVYAGLLSRVQDVDRALGRPARALRRRARRLRPAARRDQRRGAPRRARAARPARRGRAGRAAAGDAGGLSRRPAPAPRRTRGQARGAAGAARARRAGARRVRRRGAGGPAAHRLRLRPRAVHRRRRGRRDGRLRHGARRRGSTRSRPRSCAAWTRPTGTWPRTTPPLIPARACDALQAAARALLGEDVDARPGVRPVGASRAAELRNALAAATRARCSTRRRSTATSPSTTGSTASPACASTLRAWEQATVLRRCVRRRRARARAAPAALPRGRGLARPGARPRRPRSTASACSTPRTSRSRSTGRPAVRAAARRVDRDRSRRAEDDDRASTFHYDRPGTEPPQACCSSTPARPRGGWRWEDLVGALNETLDLARLRAVEPAHVARRRPTRRFLPADGRGHALRASRSRPTSPPSTASLEQLEWPDRYTVDDIVAALGKRRSPTVTLWNRLEGRPAHRGLRPRAAGRGPRRAVDADPPVADRRVPRRGRGLAGRRAKSTSTTTRLTRYRGRGDGAACRSTTAVPLETQVERLPLAVDRRRAGRARPPAAARPPLARS